MLKGFHFLGIADDNRRKVILDLLSLITCKFTEQGYQKIKRKYRNMFNSQEVDGMFSVVNKLVSLEDDVEHEVEVLSNKILKIKKEYREKKDLLLKSLKV